MLWTFVLGGCMGLILLDLARRAGRGWPAPRLGRSSALLRLGHGNR